MLIAVLVPLLLILGSIRLVMTDSYLHLAYRMPAFPADPYGFTLEDRLRYAPFAVDYLVSGQGIEYLSSLTLPDGGPLFTERELSHMADVQAVTRWAFAVLTGAALICGVLGVLLARGRAGRAALRRGLSGGAWLLLGMLGALLVYVLLDWNHFFDAFHDLFFVQGTWRFYYDDSLIRLFPIAFWQNAALSVGGLSALSAVLIIVGCRWWARRAAIRAS
jgi:integral membrane protein (TIGR01906 family)